MEITLLWHSSLYTDIGDFSAIMQYSVDLAQSWCNVILSWLVLVFAGTSFEYYYKHKQANTWLKYQDGNVEIHTLSAFDLITVMPLYVWRRSYATTYFLITNPLRVATAKNSTAPARQWLLIDAW